MITTDFEFTIEWMEKAKKNCESSKRMDAAALWGDAIKILKTLRERVKELEKFLRDANRGAETNAIVNRGLADKLVAVYAERDSLKAMLERAKKQFFLLSFPDDDATCEDSWRKLVVEGKGK